MKLSFGVILAGAAAASLLAGVGIAASEAAIGLGPEGGKAAFEGRGGPGHHGRRMGARHAMGMLRAADANADKSVTRAEVDALSAEMFAWLDRNSDGKLDLADRSPIERRLVELRKADFAEAGEDGGLRERRGGLKRMDADGDGAVSQAEFASRSAPIFDKLDTDKNAIISPAELDAAAARAEKRRYWWRG